MKQKSKKFIVGVVLLIIGVIGILDAFVEQENLVYLLIGSVLFIAVGVALIILDKKSLRKTETVLPKSENSNDIYAEAAEARAKKEYFSFRVAGVTFNNGRKTRQAILRKIKWNDEPFDGFINWTLDKYDYEGSPAVGVYANGEQIGNVPKDILDFVLNNWERIRRVYNVDISGGGTDNEGKQINFGAKVTLVMDKE